ncbi:OsmC family protein [Sphingomonas sp. SM33]|uniref:OsmC family protein n=1 Tax=Sphingomonas telluris TaxID=2907998 RepID=A0ABS9VJ79_9SPHN|nr:OsmC family protein [Sphingomonas telluris]MCH8615046.1 OsmC family protein [Sphingomonas telluris]
MLDTVKNAPVNGLDLQALGEVVEAIEADKSKAIVGFDVTTRWLGQTRSETIVEGFTLAGERIPRSHKIVADEPHELLGSDSAPNPQELLMAAFNACITVGYVAGAALKGITLDSLEIKTRGELDLRGFLGLSDSVPPGYQNVDYEVRIKGDGSAEDFAEIHETVMKTSPNYFNMSRPIKMNGSLRVG